MPTPNRFVVNEAAWDHALHDARVNKARILGNLGAARRILDALLLLESTNAFRSDLQRVVEYFDECEDAGERLNLVLSDFRSIVEA